MSDITCSWYEDCTHYKQLQELKQKYNEVLKLAKDNADSYEYCIQELEKELEPFKDDYFKGLSSEQIAELAKKSIRLTSYNRELEHKLEQIKNYIETLSVTDSDFVNSETYLRIKEILK